ncbi:two-component regulator propeller domain-containing protein [Candidatus Omnitrophota bacterium]
MKNIIISLITVIFFIFFTCVTSSEGQWKQYIPCNDINGLAFEGDYIWCANNGGIVKYNKIHGDHEIFDALDFHGTFNFYSVLIEDNGTKWFSGGGVILSYNGTSWESYTAYGRITSAAIDHDGVKWFASDAGALHLEKETVRKYRYSDGFTNDGANCVAVDGNNVKWFGSSKGLFSFNGTTWVQYTKENSELLSNNVKSLLIDENGTFYIGTSVGVTIYDGSVWTTYSEKDGLVSNYIKSMAIDNNGILWIGTYRGLSSYDGEKWKSFTTENSELPDNEIRTILPDEEGSIWITTGQQGKYTTPKYGLTRYDGTEWTTIKLPGLEGDIIYAITVDNYNTKWISTYNELVLSRFDGISWTTFTDKDGLLSNSIRSIAVDHNNVKWFGSWNGVTSFDGTSMKIFTVADGFVKDQVDAITVDQNNVKWFGTQKGISSFDGEVWSDFNVTEGFENESVISAATDLDSVKWFGTPLDGVLSFDGSVWKYYTEKDGLVNDNVNAIAVDHDNVKWFGTGYWGDNSGLSSFDGENWTTYTTDDGLCSNVINGIAVDDSNIKWFVSNKSSQISSFDGSEWSSFSPELYTGGYTSISIDHDGVAWLGTEREGMLSFTIKTGKQSSVESQNTTPAAIVITGIYPNPFNESTVIEVSIDTEDFANLSVYNLLGQKIKKLGANPISPGTHRILWDGKDNSGKAVSSGIYFIHLHAGGSVVTKKIAFVR